MTKSAHRPEPPASYIARPRQCLMCDTSFDSSWAGERICPECKNGKGFERAAGLPEQFA